MYSQAIKPQCNDHAALRCAADQHGATVLQWPPPTTHLPPRTLGHETARSSIAFELSLMTTLGEAACCYPMRVLSGWLEDLWNGEYCPLGCLASWNHPSVCCCRWCAACHGSTRVQVWVSWFTTLTKVTTEGIKQQLVAKSRPIAPVLLHRIDCLVTNIDTLFLFHNLAQLYQSSFAHSQIRTW